MLGARGTCQIQENNAVGLSESHLLIISAFLALLSGKPMSINCLRANCNGNEL